MAKIKYNVVEGYNFSHDEIEQKLAEKFSEINVQNCLNKLVTSFFLEIDWVYTEIFVNYLLKEFTEVINNCKISLNSLNDIILYHFSVLVRDQQLASLIERKIKGDKFISNIYRSRIDHLMLKKMAPN